MDSSAHEGRAKKLRKVYNVFVLAARYGQSMISTTMTTALKGLLKDNRTIPVSHLGQLTDETH